MFPRLLCVNFSLSWLSILLFFGAKVNGIIFNIILSFFIVSINATDFYIIHILQFVRFFLLVPSVLWNLGVFYI